jgi:ABC-2 type transport system ATP-binding protein
MPNIVLHTDGLTKRYGNLVAVNNLSLDVYEGEVFGFLGPNGAGKTTAITMMCGLLKPDAGQVVIHGQPVAGNNTDIAARVGVCPQEIVVWNRLTCIEQLQFTGEMYGLSGGVARQSGEQLLRDLDLTDKRSVQAHALSGGMKRRLNLALALVHDPDILVLDEPEAGLDPQSRLKVRDYIHSLAHRKTVILTTHNMDEAERVADRVAIIDHGELLVLDTPDALKRRIGEGDVLEISLKGDAQVAQRGAAALASLAARVQTDAASGMLIVRARDAVNLLPAVVQALSAAGLACGEVHLREATLEDVFIQLTGRRLRE